MGDSLKKEQGILAATALFSWNSAILQNKMASHYTESLLEFSKAEISLHKTQEALVNNRALGIHLQFVPDNPSENPLAGWDYYQIESDPNLKVKLQAVVGIYRDPHAIVRLVRRKTWEQMSI
jgi:hypothetical protein